MDALTPTAIIGPPNRHAVPPQPRGRAAGIETPLVESVGDIAGLRPRRQPRDGGEVPGADFDLIDALPRRIEWTIVATWLLDTTSVASRRQRLADLAAFLRWVHAALPGVGLLEVSKAVGTSYREQLATGTAIAGVGRVGVPLGAATVARRLAVMSSLGEDIAAALDVANPWKRVTRPKVPRTGTTPALRLLDLIALLDGARAIADKRPQDSAAVLLMTLVALRVGEVCALTVGAVQADGDHTVVLVTRKGGDRMSREPITPKVHQILTPLLDERPGSALLLLRDDGRPWDRWRAQTALNRAARRGGLSRDAIAALSPHVGRATAATLLRGQGIQIDKVQELLGHASPVTTQRYDRGGALMDGHAGYDLATLAGWGPAST